MEKIEKNHEPFPPPLASTEAIMTIAIRTKKKIKRFILLSLLTLKFQPQLARVFFSKEIKNKTKNILEICFEILSSASLKSKKT
jgi:hypothetical protein